MDQNRQIRFLIPPFFFYGLLMVGIYFNDDFTSIFFDQDIILRLIAAATLLTVPLGYLISSISIIFLRKLSIFNHWDNYEAPYSKKTFRRILEKLNLESDFDLEGEPQYKLSVIATFDHGLLSSGINNWIMRRWNSFNISTHSLVAVLLAFFFGPVFDITRNCEWGIATIILSIIFFCNAKKAWKETKEMIEFQSYRK